MYYNRAVECGRVGCEPTIRTSKSGKNFVTLKMGVKRGTRKEYDNFSLSAYGEVGNDILENVHEGDFICVTGPVSATGYTGADGKVYANLMMIVLKWKKDPTVEMTMEAERAVDEGNAAEEEMDNDEILF